MSAPGELAPVYAVLLRHDADGIPLYVPRSRARATDKAPRLYAKRGDAEAVLREPDEGPAMTEQQPVLIPLKEKYRERPSGKNHFRAPATTGVTKMPWKLSGVPPRALRGRRGTVKPKRGTWR